MTSPPGSLNSRNMFLSPSEKSFLRKLAHLTIEAAVHHQELPDPLDVAQQLELEISTRLEQKRGAFVTLHLGGQLRGCIGYIEGHKSLMEAVVDNGRSAAMADPRFSPVTPQELPQLDLEISALTPLVEVDDPLDIEIGKHGIFLLSGRQRSVFLPQVATEQGWDLETTLGHLALKAGLAPNGWQEGARFKVFEAEIF